MLENNKKNKPLFREITPETIAKRINPVLTKYPILVCYLFGSYADGTAYANSDIDLAILMKDFDKKHPNYQLMTDIREDFHDALSDLVNKVDVVFLQATENIPLQFKIISKGKVLFSADDDYRTDFEDLVVKYHMDLAPFLEKSYREMIEDIREGNFIV